MSSEIFFKDRDLPFAECRYSTGSKREYKAHMHSTFSVGALDSGQVEYRVEKQSSTLSVDSLALINPEALHSCNAITEEGRSYYMHHFLRIILLIYNNLLLHIIGYRVCKQ